jgi:CYTH domain-containing protein
MLELEKTYLVKYLPKGLESCERKEIIDVYLPKTSAHPLIRLRKNGEIYEITKKNHINPDDSSELVEDTILLSKEEYDDLFRQVDGKRVHKIRYYYEYQGKRLEVDVFQDALLGLVLVDVEFPNASEKEKFVMPDFCLCEVTQEEFIAGGMVCGKTYEDLAPQLEKFGYKKIKL